MKRMTILLAALLLGGCLPQNTGLESQHKPIVTAAGAQVPGCPDWSSQGFDSATGTDSNYGCATNANLAAMIADPNDLVHGKSAPGEGAEIAVRTIGAFRAGAPTGTGSGGAGGAASTAGGGAGGAAQGPQK